MAGVAIALVANSVPELVVEVSDLLGDTDADANMSSRREGAGRGIWFVTDLASDLENALQRLLIDSWAAVKRAVHRADRHACQLRDQRNPALLSRCPHSLFHFERD